VVEPDEHRTRTDLSGAGRSVAAPDQRRLELQATVGTVDVVVPGELVEQGAQVCLVDDDVDAPMSSHGGDALLGFVLKTGPGAYAAPHGSTALRAVLHCARGLAPLRPVG
jgi:hypothetical protein